jgi:hypothetical protein
LFEEFEEFEIDFLQKRFFGKFKPTTNNQQPTTSNQQPATSNR